MPSILIETRKEYTQQDEVAIISILQLVGE